MGMNRVVVQSRVGADGILQITLPIGAADADREVEVTIAPVSPVPMTPETSELKESFNRLADTWSNETGGYSVVSRRYAHPAYQQLLTLGEGLVPLIIRRLKERPDWWFEALTALAKPETNPVRKGATFSEAVDAWLEWGRRNELIR
jgi:hypothetical protein